MLAKKFFGTYRLHRSTVFLYFCFAGVSACRLLKIKPVSNREKYGFFFWRSRLLRYLCYAKLALAGRSAKKNIVFYAEKVVETGSMRIGWNKYRTYNIRYLEEVFVHYPENSFAVCLRLTHALVDLSGAELA